MTRMVNTPTGVDADVVTAGVQLTAPAGFLSDPQWRTFADQHGTILEQIRRQPGVSSAGATSVLPLQIGWRMPCARSKAMRRVEADDRLIAQCQTVSEGYFESMRPPSSWAVRFPRSTPTSAPVVIVSELHESSSR